MHIFQGAHEFLPHLRLWPLLGSNPSQSGPKCLPRERERERETIEVKSSPIPEGERVGEAEMH